MRHLLVILTLWSAHVAILFSAAVGFHRNLDNLVDNSFDTTSSKAAGFRHHFRRDGEKPLLRIMPLGASITQGFDAGLAETLQCGYRKPLRDELRYRGYEVNMVGSRVHGNFSDLQHEGWPGYEIEGVASKMLTVMTTQKPNLVLMLLGSNDCFHAKRDGNLGYARSAKDRMNAMLEKIYDLSPGVTVILATLPPTTDPANEPYIQAANAGYRELVSDLQGKSRNIELAEMYTDWFEPGDRSDSIHFNDAGYAKMAAIFADAFNRVENKNWLAEPIDTGVPDNVGCYPSPDGFRGPVRTQVGSGFNDGDFEYSSVLETSKDVPYNEGAPRALLGHCHFANLVRLPNEHRPWDELIRVLDPEDRTGNSLPYVSYHTNRGDANFDPSPREIDVGQECASENVRWGDVNGDMLDDFMCLSNDGIPHVSLNRGGEPPKFEFIGAIREAKSAKSKVRLADIDGDGRADYCVVEVDGVYCWRNGGFGDVPTAKYDGFWESMVQDGKENTMGLDANSDAVGAQFIDINGDGRADSIYVHDTTRADIRINQRGDRSDGPGLRPHWQKLSAQIEGWPNDKSITRSHMLFGKVFGSGRSDRIRMEQVGQGFDYVFHFHRNTGSGGTQLRGDGVRYCDMNGRGYDDYLWISPDGNIDLFENIQAPPRWTSHGRILETKRNGKFIHVGDWDGNGLCDILAVDSATGDADMFRNTYKAGEPNPTFEPPVRIVSGSLCPQPITTSNPFDLAVRFGDLDGDGRVDYICMSPDGRSLAWLNTPSGLHTLPSTMPNQIKLSEGYDRSEHRWADVNGDGKVDFLAINKFSGEVQVWINLGTTPTLTSGMTWDRQRDIWMAGAERGANVHFPRLSRSKRADYHVAYPQTNVAETWFNEGRCVGARDDGEVRDPGLPRVEM